MMAWGGGQREALSGQHTATGLATAHPHPLPTAHRDQRQSGQGCDTIAELAGMILQLGAPAAELAVVVGGKCPCVPLETAASLWAERTMGS